MSAYSICLIEGDGIGHEVVPAGRHLLEALGPHFSYTQAEAGWATFQREGSALPQATLDAVAAADATLFGAVGSPLHRVEGYNSPIVALRRALGLYANLRPTLSQPVPASRPGIDMVIVRENSEGLYAGQEHVTADRAVGERVITRQGSTRIVELACRLAEARRGHLTIVHKANVLRGTCGLFREAALAVAEGHPTLQVDEMLVDACAMRLVTDPERFDVMVTTNLFGDILSDEAAGLVGGLGLAPSANLGDQHAVFEPVHGTAPDIAGRGIANPAATFAAIAMLLDYLGERQDAARVRRALDQALREGPLTPDLGGTATTDAFTNAVIARLGRPGSAGL